MYYKGVAVSCATVGYCVVCTYVRMYMLSLCNVLTLPHAHTDLRDHQFLNGTDLTTVMSPSGRWMMTRCVCTPDRYACLLALFAFGNQLRYCYGEDCHVLMKLQIEVFSCSFRN